MRDVGIASRTLRGAGLASGFRGFGCSDYSPSTNRFSFLCTIAAQSVIVEDDGDELYYDPMYAALGGQPAYCCEGSLATTNTDTTTPLPTPLVLSMPPLAVATRSSVTPNTCAQQPTPSPSSLPAAWIVTLVVSGVFAVLLGVVGIYSLCSAKWNSRTILARRYERHRELLENFPV